MQCRRTKSEQANPLYPQPMPHPPVDAITWKIDTVSDLSDSLWIDIGDAESTHLETMFRTSSTNGMVAGKWFDGDGMRWGNEYVRRCASYGADTTVFFWDDTEWKEFDPYAQCTFDTALKAGRKATTICVGGHAWYKIDFVGMTQTNLQTGFQRPIRTANAPRPRSPVVLEGGDDDDDEDDDEDDSDEEDWADADFLCPITQQPMKTPVVASDGHSYELAAISRWLVRNHTSPMTGARMISKRLLLNHTLRKVMRSARSRARPFVPASPSNPPIFVPTSPSYSPTSP